LRGFDNYRQQSVDFSRRQSRNAFRAGMKNTVNAYSTGRSRSPCLRTAMRLLAGRSRERGGFRVVGIFGDRAVSNLLDGFIWRRGQIGAE
jgi:hypothetical protein